ncbi:MAG TPA: diguanylate cyclase [Candidatus Dormibacteraeota bacterium]|nr:diguanylate cyclase [Candidatus Dormibacteraeota bacterium]
MSARIPVVVVIDDEDEMLQLERLTLEALPSRVFAYRDAEEALGAMRSNPPDVIVTDVMLPGMSGTELIAALRAEPRTRHVPVVLVTARGEVTERVLGLELGAADYIAKPFYPAELRARVAAALRGKALEPQLRAERVELAQAAYTDALTGAANRRAFEDALEAAVAFASRTRRPLSLLYVDLDAFKELNDRKGHAEGDRALQRVASTLLSSVRGTDTVARIGGDEFAVILLGCDITDAENFTNRLFRAAGQDAIASFSAGVATSRSVVDGDATTLRAAADRALYQAKAAGRGVWRSEALP